MDFDGDGILDMISGSYDPGDLYLFRGLGEGEYAARELLEDENGVPLVHHPVELAKYHRIQEETGERYPQAEGALQARIASFGSWPAAADWDGDGDLDMLIGSFRGELWLRENVGTRTEPVFSGESVRIEVDGEPVKVRGHANPVVADWDGDGRWDLVLGASDGSVWWTRNTGSATEPELGPLQQLLPAKSENKFLDQYVMPGEKPAPGVRSQICVTDYDGDGKPDLLVGDYSSLYRLKDDLGEEEKAELSRILDREENLAGDAGADERAEVRKAKRAFFTDKSRHSFVWLYRRR